MGAWGADAFDNDGACDWAAEFVENGTIQIIDAKLDEVLSPDYDYLDADIGAEGLAACEVVARLHGRWGKADAYTEAVDQWVVDHPQIPSDELTRKALLAVDRITGDMSELAELWLDSGGGDWRVSVAELRARIAGPAA